MRLLRLVRALRGVVRIGAGRVRPSRVENCRRRVYAPPIHPHGREVVDILGLILPLVVLEFGLLVYAL
ncbi:MAG TPA: hypothetical protein VHK04_07140 [Castellaniella sp.]|nr:hypothetical protein [Castellaniella sp.]